MSRCKPDVVSVKFKNPDPGVQRVVEILELGERTILYWHLIRSLPERYKNSDSHTSTSVARCSALRRFSS